ncbi:MAG: AI-2E family transporter [Phyllobacteriaceae bacterium]|nr:AI-2E family transporter [Phyllobacteriaceae bacterium]MBA92846.1 AI-2E family transporter [Phyllobacteriaceae bacterium]
MVSVAESARNLAFVLLAVCLTGWLLWIGSAVLWPIFAAILSTYILSAVAEFIARVPVLRLAPRWLRSLGLAAAFAAVLLFFAAIVGSTVDSLVRVAPTYQQNLVSLAGQLSQWAGFEQTPTWETLRTWLAGRVSLQALITATLGQVTAMGGQIILIIFYVVFLMAERGQFAAKLTSVAGDAERARRAHEVIASINRSITDYLAVKTLINVILGVVSYLIMIALGIDFAAFWAILIGLMNYIPYVGSIVGVAFPVLLSLAQFGSLGQTAVAAVALTLAQMSVGYVVEPRMIGQSVNLSPFVVMVALAIWSALWGVPGAILAVPLTAILSIVLAASPSTRGLSVLLSADGNAPSPERAMSR